VEYKENSTQFGDLDGDGVEDAVIVLTERGGGTNTNYYLAAQLNQEGEPVDAGAVLVDGNIQIIDLVMEDGQVMLEATTRGPGDANCCASHSTERTFSLQDGVLAEVGEPTEPVRVSAEYLNGTSWALTELADGKPALKEPPITITFEDGSLAGSGGCNSYRAEFTLSEDNPFIINIGPILATRLSCPEPIMEQEAAYLAALEKASLWGYDLGKLAISYVEEGELREHLLFTATAVE
jgi:heat shock protein HslJ